MPLDFSVARASAFLHKMVKNDILLRLSFTEEINNGIRWTSD